MTAVADAKAVIQALVNLMDAGVKAAGLAVAANAAALLQKLQAAKEVLSQSETGPLVDD